MCKLILVANMKTNIREIPYSSRRYYISENGTVFDRDGCVIEKKIKDGHYCVKLTWINGVDEYKVAVLMLLTYKTLSLPDHLLERVIPLYRDCDPDNLSAANVLYKFKDGPIEVEDYPGFYYIPMNANYAISRNGELINWRTGKYKTWSFTKPIPEKNARGGYAYNRVVNDEGYSVCLFRHRAICLTFKDYGDNVGGLVVNHINGVPGDDRIDNVEWCTYRDNNIHAVKNGLRLDNKPVLSKDLRTGVVTKFSSCNECAKHYGHPQGSYIADRIKNDKLYSDLLLFKYDDGAPWKEYDLTKEKIHISKSTNTILARNVFTEQIVLFNGTGQAAQYTGVKAGTILSHVKEEMLVPVGGWNFRYAHRNVVWPKHSKRHLKVYEKYPIYPPNGLIVIKPDGSEDFYPSLADGADVLKINKGLIKHSIRYDRPLKNGYRFKLFDIRKSLSHPTE